MTAVAVAVVAAAPANASKARAPKGAVAAALQRAVLHFAAPEKLKVAVTLRSSIDRRWSLVTGVYGQHGLWAGWVRHSPSGHYVVEIFRTHNLDPGTRPPCDIRPAYSEPAC